MNLAFIIHWSYGVVIPLNPRSRRSTRRPRSSRRSKRNSKVSRLPQRRSEIDLAVVASWLTGIAAILSAVGAVLINLHKKDPQPDIDELAEYNRKLTALLKAQGIEVPPLPRSDE